MECATLVNPDDTDSTIYERPSGNDALDAFVLLVDAYEHLSGLLELQLIVPLGGYILIGGVLLISDAKELAANAVFLPVPNTADVQTSEHLNEILKGHPEGSIFVV